MQFSPTEWRDFALLAVNQTARPVKVELDDGMQCGSSVQPPSALTHTPGLCAYARHAKSNTLERCGLTKQCGRLKPALKGAKGWDCVLETTSQMS